MRIPGLFAFRHCKLPIQDRKPLRDDVRIPQSLEDQAMAQLDRLSKEGEVSSEEHMAEMIKASCMHVIHTFGLWGEVMIDPPRLNI